MVGKPSWDVNLQDGSPWIWGHPWRGHWGFHGTVRAPVAAAPCCLAELAPGIEHVWRMAAQRGDSDDTLIGRKSRDITIILFKTSHCWTLKGWAQHWEIWQQRLSDLTTCLLHSVILTPSPSYHRLGVTRLSDGSSDKVAHRRASAEVNVYLTTTFGNVDEGDHEPFCWLYRNQGNSVPENYQLLGWIVASGSWSFIMKKPVHWEHYGS